MCTIEKVMPDSQRFQISAPSIPSPIQIRNFHLEQNNQDISHRAIRSQNEHIELIRLKKNLLRSNLKNSNLINRTPFKLNSKENLTAASLKEIRSDSNVFIQKYESQTSCSSIDSSKLFESEPEQVEKEIFERKYQVLNKIGQGAHSTVYKSICKVDNKIYALKKIRSVSVQNQKKLRNIYRMVRLFKHQNIIQYHEFFFDDLKRTAYIVMEYCEFNDLRSQLQKRSIAGESFSARQIKQFSKKVASVLQYLHSEGVCHRDLKPQNILFDQLTGQIKVIDLDVCGVKKSKPQPFDLWTNTGTLLYRAPQSFQIGYSQKADVWSLGTVIYELICGQVPFEAEYEKDFLRKLKNQSINFDRITINPLLKLILQKCLQKDPTKRASSSQILDMTSFRVRDDFQILENIKTQVKSQYKYFQDTQISQICLGNVLKLNFI